MQPSPYTPGELAQAVPGRAAQLAEFDERLSYLIDLRRFVGRIRVDLGPRGYGKSSLLRQYQLHAQARGALTVWVTAGEEPGLIASLAHEIETAGPGASQSGRFADSVNSLTVGVGVTGMARLDATLERRDPVSSPIESRAFEKTVRQAVAAADTALVILIDEIQAADAVGLKTLAYAWQHLQAEAADLPAAVFAAGLPNSPEVAASAVTFSERFAFRPLNLLSDEAEVMAIVAPSNRLGVHWTPEALDSAVRISAGYPYTVQLIADAAWAAAQHPDPGQSITVDHVAAGRVSMQSDLESLFRARWAHATAQERMLLQSMAVLGDGPVKRADIAEQLGVTISSLSVPRAHLIDKGLIQRAGHGALEFTIPGFGVFVRDLVD